MTTTGSMLSGLGVVLTILGGSSGIASLLLVRRQRSKLGADAAQVVSAAAVAMVKPLEERLSSAEDRAGRAEQRAYSAEQRAFRAEQTLTAVEADAHQLRSMLVRLQRAIMDPGATVEWLRELVGRTSI